MIVSQTFHFPFLHYIIFCRMPDQQRRIPVMFLSVIFHTVVIAFDGVTIDASVEATFISAYVDTFNAIADIPLIFVFFGKEGVAGDSFDQFFVDTQSGRDSQMSQINFGGAGIQLDSRIFVDGIPERDGYFFNLLFSQRLYVELADCGADMLVMVNKSQHTLFGMVFKLPAPTWKWMS